MKAIPIFVALLLMVGCSTAELDEQIAQREAEIKRLNDERDALAAARTAIAAELEKERNKPVVDAQRVKELESKLDAAAKLDAKREQETLLQQAVAAELAKLREKAGDVPGQIGEGMQTVGRFVPAPWGELLGLAGIVVGGFSERRRRKDVAGATNALGSLAALEAGGLITIPQEAKELLNDIQTPEAKALVQRAKAVNQVTMKVAARTPGTRAAKS